MVHNSWRIYSPERRAWILFTAPSPTEKRKWINALEKTKESIVVDPKLREMAVVTTALADSEMMAEVLKVIIQIPYPSQVKSQKESISR